MALQSRLDSDFLADQRFFVALSLALSLVIIAGFGQLVLRGIHSFADFPVRVHLHAIFLVAWLAIFCVQNWLAYVGKIALHRKLGWAAMLLVTAIVIANIHVTVMTIVDGRLPLQIAPGFWVSLGFVDTLGFGGLVVWAVALRHSTQWHRRLMFGATLMLSAAGLNRLFDPIFGDLGPIVSIAGQLGFVAVLAWHDSRAMGRIHPCTLVLAVLVLIQRFSPSILAEMPLVADLAESFTP